MIHKKTLLLILLMTFLCFNLSEAFALKVTLKRVVFEGAKRSEVLTIVNSGPDSRAYRLQWNDYYMSEDVGLRPKARSKFIPENFKSASDIVVFAPRRVVVGPRSAQQVRLMLRAPSDLPDGEYRSHLSITDEGEVDKIKRDVREPNNGKRNVNIDVLPMAVMPVIVRRGPMTSGASIENLQAKVNQKGKIEVDLSLVRNGNSSIFGNFDFVCNPATDNSYLLRAINGVAVYAEIKQRNLNYKINKLSGEAACRTLEIGYSEVKGAKALERISKAVTVK